MNNYNHKLSRAEMKRRREFEIREENIKKAVSSQLDKTIDVQPVEDYFTLELKSIMLNEKLSAKEKQRLKTLTIETERQKKALVIQLRKTPIVQIACERSGVGRSTYYKWRVKDRTFARAADRALEAGRFFINDLAKSKLLQMIKDGNTTAIIFWLKHNDPQFAPVNRIIHEYEIATTRPSVEENNIAAQEISKVLGEKLTPKFTTEEIKNQIEEEIEESERNAPSDKRLKSFEDDSGEK
ncbi:hypothetical protein A3D42_00670 [Candidatus Nomurabacteria bacterium RIFCSPHIGHO2_02_FULL_41_18]|uniref:Uncharacterized protein n=1 Tax=Candidatus Nomurabacteria bacterium RIFCSPHIGHO2_02_FULL_41_18 TaxID=1801754 RepID=A0A1F6W7B5_9BACT|nr:MAG: hypothetical protein A3D42_00670 [Candidatus Nomurabacteria bacterium RIFCSPHIGHO2_02_FULL_41_18]OGJ00356.1 MAG: hypothetical protein A3I90_01360 [Candidatus Nomurabacteria bacterium RIFCSPLOWO2_02_FULL_41_9]